jgi:Raf kinase inhibitor-like YbhB/YbcL family protein
MLRKQGGDEIAPCATPQRPTRSAQDLDLLGLRTLQSCPRQEADGRHAVKRSIASLATGRLILAGGIAIVGAGGTANAQQKVFDMSSTTFKDGQMMPKKVANSMANFPQNKNCVGENVSPQLSWVNPPGGTKSFAILMTDPEGRGGGGVNHWVAYGIPADVTGFAEGEVSKPSPKYVGGKSRLDVGHYSGPCMPPNSSARHYTFVLVATDLEPNALPPGLTKEELTAKIAPFDPKVPRHDLGSTGIVGLFANPAN